MPPPASTRSPSPAARHFARIAPVVAGAFALGCESIIGAHFDVHPAETHVNPSTASGAGGAGGAGGSAGSGGGSGGTDGPVAWAHSLGGPSHYDYGAAVAMDDAGNVFALGLFGGEDRIYSLDCMPQGMEHKADLYVAKILPGGACGWMRLAGGAQAQEILLDKSGNVLVLGAMGGDVNFGGGIIPWGGGEDIVVGRLSADDGTDLGSFGLGTAANEYSEDLALGPDGSMYIVGHYWGNTNLGSIPATALVGSSTNDAFVAKLDPSGEPIWAKGFPSSSGEDGFHSVTITEDGDGVIVAGNFQGTVDFDGTKAVSNGADDVVILRLDSSDGSVDWVRSFGEPGVDQAFNIATRGTQVLATGWFSGDVDAGNNITLSSAGPKKDIFLVLLDDPNGWTSWAAVFGAARDDGGFGLAVANNGDVILSGQFRDTLWIGDKSLVAKGDQDMFLARLPADEHLWEQKAVWARAYGALLPVDPPAEERARKIVVSAEGRVAVTGTYGLSVDFGPATLTSLGASDAFVALIDPR